ncbi:hypothetical protein ABHF91_11415 [Pseudaeromonas sp. ZJS20]|uniref:hypothetical protein n=1 Tax=Pseudaeromonas aegiceratis TaxID=3153928 RepID=UPI00390CD996
MKRIGPHLLMGLLWAGCVDAMDVSYKVGWLPDPPYLTAEALAPQGADAQRLQAVLPGSPRLQFEQWPVVRQRRGLADGELDIALSLTRVDDATAWLSVPVRQAQYVLVIDPLQLGRYQEVSQLADAARQGMALGVLQDSRLQQETDRLLGSGILVHSLRDLDQLIRLLWLGRLNGLLLDKALLEQEPRLKPLLRLINLPPMAVSWAFAKRRFSAQQMAQINARLQQLASQPQPTQEVRDAGL